MTKGKERATETERETWSIGSEFEIKPHESLLRIPESLRQPPHRISHHFGESSSGPEAVVQQHKTTRDDDPTDSLRPMVIQDQRATDSLTRDFEIAVPRLNRVSEPGETDGQVAGHPEKLPCDQLSEVTSLIESVFSEASITTTVSGLTQSSGYSIQQIATATQELVRILHEDKVLNPLYKKAIESSTIGPRRFARNFRKLLKRYSSNLKKEVKESLEYLAASVVGGKARSVANSILEKYQAPLEGSRNKNVDNDTHSEGRSSTEDDDGVDDRIFEDLVVVRNFLTGSNALLVLREEFRGFVIPTKSTKGQPQTKSLRSQMRSIFNIPKHSSVLKYLPGSVKTYTQSFKDVLVKLSLLEPPCDAGRQRLRLKCNCGARFFDDYVETEAGGLTKLQERFEAISKLRVISASSEQSSSSRESPFRDVLMALRNIFRPLKAIFSNARDPTLPQHQNLQTAAAPNTANSSPAARNLHLMSCMHWGKYGRKLHQDMLEGIQSNQQLFFFLKKRLKQHRARLRSVLTMRDVKGILFVKFRLDMGGSVDVRDHDAVCHNHMCECLPPETRVKPKSTAEYLCDPIPAQTFPPIGPHHLMHYLSSPSCIDEQQTWALDQFPKRTRGPLSGNPRSPAEGWGIFYQEGWDGEKLGSVLLIVFFLGSLVFGVLWSVVKMDIQGAFGVSSWWLSASGAFLAFLATRTHRL